MVHYKTSFNTKKTVVEEQKNKKDVRHKENKQQNGGYKSYLMSKLFKCKWIESHSAVSDFEQSMEFSRPEYSRSVEWVTFPFSRGSSQLGSNPGFPHCGQILYQLSHKGSPRILECVAYPFSSRSSRPRDRTGVSCIAGRFFTN